MINGNFPEIRDLGIIGDRRTLAIITKQGSIVWYCPQRFDCPSLFASLLDSEKGGSWTLEMPNTDFSHRRYLEDSGILETTFQTQNQEWTLTDWMPLGNQLPRGICREFSPVSTAIKAILKPAPNYGQSEAKLKREGNGISIGDRYFIYASHSLKIEQDAIIFTLSQGESGWITLLEDSIPPPTHQDIATWFNTTLNHWRDVASHATYRGLYKKEVADSLRALRLLTFEENGAILAAGTTSLPEEMGGNRNYDYRYVWLRDTDMIVSALVRAGSDGLEERRFLGFLCGLGEGADGMPLAPALQPNGKVAPKEQTLKLIGYQNHQPVRIGNRVRSQRQLDTLGNVLLAAKLIYNRYDTREHWSLIEKIADYLAENWHQPDHGIWEETQKKQYTVSKVITACGLYYLADLAKTKAQAQRWRNAVREIQTFVEKECLTSEGAYAAVAGEEGVDVSAALFPVWCYTPADSPEMLATMKVLERDYATGHLYRRHLVESDSSQEGAFLAGTLWVAQYWVMRQDMKRVRAILDETLKYSNDLGLFAEEADSKTGKMVGNIPQTFVHASFIGTVIDLQTGLKDKEKVFCQKTVCELFSE